MAAETPPADDTPELRRRLALLRVALPQAGGFDTRQFRTWVPDAGSLVEVVESRTPPADAPSPTDDTLPSADRDE
jgi:hypothetical protein